MKGCPHMREVNMDRLHGNYVWSNVHNIRAWYFFNTQIRKNQGEIGSPVVSDPVCQRFLMAVCQRHVDMHVKVDSSLWDISWGSCKGIRIRATYKQAGAEKGAYDDPSPVWCLSSQEWGAYCQHEEGHHCDGHPQQQLEQSDQQREATKPALMAVLWSWAFSSLLAPALLVRGTFLLPHCSHLLLTFSPWLSLLRCSGWMSLPAVCLSPRHVPSCQGPLSQ